MAPKLCFAIGVKDLEPHSVLVFRAIAQQGSMTAAARLLGWTQPAVSQHVKRLERHLGTPLLVRSGRSTRLTEAGRVLAAHADRLVALLDTAEREIAHLAGGETGRVRVQAFPSALATIVPTALALLRASHPGLITQTTEARPTQARAAVVAGDCDVAVVFEYQRSRKTAADTAPAFEEASSAAGARQTVRNRHQHERKGAGSPAARLRGEADAGSDVLSVPLAHDAVHVILPADDLLGGSEPIPLGALSGRPWIAGCPSCRQHLLRAAAVSGFEPRIEHVTDDYVVAQSLVAAGLGVALLPTRTLAVLRHPGITSVPIADEVFVVSAIVHSEALRVPAVRLFLDTLRAAAGLPDAP